MVDKLGRLIQEVDTLERLILEVDRLETWLDRNWLMFGLIGSY